jgi:hypothetical protein
MTAKLAKLEQHVCIGGVTANTVAATVRDSIDGIVPTHAAAAPAINFALRSS